MKTNRTSSRPAPKSGPGTSPLVTSAAAAQRDKAVLRRGRERLEDERTVDETSARSSVVARRMPSP